MRRSAQGARPLVCAGAEHDVPGRDRAGGGLQQEPAVLPGPKRLDVNAFPNGRLEPVRIALEVRDDLVAGHESVRVPAVVRSAGKLDGPVWRDEAEAVPASAPRLADPAPFEYHVLDSGASELVAHGQPGLARANDDDVDTLPHRGGVSATGP